MAPNGKRQTIRLGKASMPDARDFCRRVESLLSSRALGRPPDLETSLWLAAVDRTIQRRLGAVGLSTAQTVVTLGELLQSYPDDVKPSTASQVELTQRNLKDFWGPDKHLASITHGDARRFRAWLTQFGAQNRKPLARATVSRRCRRAKQYFAFALRHRWIPENPFEGVKTGAEVNRARDFVVSREITQKVLDKAPDLQFKAIVALVRFCGLRCPSEVVPLRWEQIQWDHRTLAIESPKTEHHDGQDRRTAPIFPEAMTHLQALWDQAERGQPLVFPSYQVSGTALSKRLGRACKLAGVSQWKKPWQNIRASCETELLEKYPIHVVAAWLGHSPAIALRHYTQIAKDRAARAAQGEAKPEVLQSPLDSTMRTPEDVFPG